MGAKLACRLMRFLQMDPNTSEDFPKHPNTFEKVTKHSKAQKFSKKSSVPKTSERFQTLKDLVTQEIGLLNRETLE